MNELTKALASWLFALGLLMGLVSITIWSVVQLSHALAELSGNERSATSHHD